MTNAKQYCMSTKANHPLVKVHSTKCYIDFVNGKINTAVLANLQVSNVLNCHRSPHGPDNPPKHMWPVWRRMFNPKIVNFWLTKQIVVFLRKYKRPPFSLLIIEQNSLGFSNSTALWQECSSFTKLRVQRWTSAWGRMSRTPDASCLWSISTAVQFQKSCKSI